MICFVVNGMHIDVYQKTKSWHPYLKLESKQAVLCLLLNKNQGVEQHEMSTAYLKRDNYLIQVLLGGRTGLTGQHARPREGVCTRGHAPAKTRQFQL